MGRRFGHAEPLRGIAEPGAKRGSAAYATKMVGNRTRGDVISKPVGEAGMSEMAQPMTPVMEGEQTARASCGVVAGPTRGPEGREESLSRRMVKAT